MKPPRDDVWRIDCDGSAVPNPGRMGLGAVLVAPDGTRHVCSQVAPGHGCNNEAELRALMVALHTARSLGATAVHARTDNSIVVAQLGDAAAPPVARLAPLFDEARALLRLFDAATLSWIPRHRNGEADALARAALGFAPRPAAVRMPKRRRPR
ncbi:MAG: ribonuclease HI family protein [Solirubrobacteraceae bacterium]|nr:ribonuclease HI family protein [Solirubrobacteraceae bacterium]